MNLAPEENVRTKTAHSATVYRKLCIAQGHGTRANIFITTSVMFTVLYTTNNTV